MPKFMFRLKVDPNYKDPLLGWPLLYLEILGTAPEDQSFSLVKQKTFSVSNMGKIDKDLLEAIKRIKEK